MTASHPANSSSLPAAQANVGAWLVLLLAGLFEVGYAISVGGSRGFTVLSWSLVALAFFLCTLFFLSVALKKIDVGIGYAVWVGIGAVGAVIVGAVVFGQEVTLGQSFWLTVILTGVIWLKLADRPAPAAQGLR